VAGRRLSPDERALWLRVAASVRRAGVVVPKAEMPTKEALAAALSDKPRVKAKVVPPAAAVHLPVRSAPVAPPKPGITLDGTWDRRIASGGAAPERMIDLHGCTVAQAHQRLLRELDMALADDVRVVLVVTGKAPRSDASRIDLPLRGIIRASIHDWVGASRHAGQIAAIRSAHQKHGGAGALYIILRRPKNGTATRQY
jgi:DNA-nicking Smr family endonuclease